MVAGCKQKMAEGVMTFVRNPTLTYVKKGAILNFWQKKLRTRAVILILTCYYFGFWRYSHFEFLAIWRLAR